MLLINATVVWYHSGVHVVLLTRETHINMMKKVRHITRRLCHPQAHL